MAESGLRKEAQTGFAAAAAYDAGRPTYLPEVVDLLLQKLEVSGVQGAKILEVAAGTGKFTEVLSRRPEKFDIVAVEPHDDMKQQLSNKKLERVTVVKGTAENLQVIQDGAFAAVIAAQSFHWFANMQALKELARVLQPAGVLGMIWNIDDYNAPREWDIHGGWEVKMRDLVWLFEDDQPRFRHEKWRSVFDEQAKGDPLTLHFADPLFGLPIGETAVEYETWLSKDDIWKRLRTLSQVAVLEGVELEKVQNMFSDAIDGEGNSVDEQGRVALHGRTILAWTSRIPAGPLESGG